MLYGEKCAFMAFVYWLLGEIGYKPLGYLTDHKKLLIF